MNKKLLCIGVVALVLQACEGAPGSAYDYLSCRSEGGEVEFTTPPKCRYNGNTYTASIQRT